MYAIPGIPDVFLLIVALVLMSYAYWVWVVTSQGDE